MQNVILACNSHTTRGEEGSKTAFCDQELTQKYDISKDQAVLLEPRLVSRMLQYSFYSLPVPRGS